MLSAPATAVIAGHFIGPYLLSRIFDRIQDGTLEAGAIGGLLAGYAASRCTAI